MQDFPRWAGIVLSGFPAVSFSAHGESPSDLQTNLPFWLLCDGNTQWGGFFFSHLYGVVLNLNVYF